MAWSKKGIICIILYTIFFIFFLLLMRGDHSVVRIWDLSHKNCWAVTPDMHLTRHNALFCNQPSSLFALDLDSESTSVSFVGGGEQTLYITHLNKEEIDLRPWDGSASQYWNPKDRQFIASDTISSQPLCIAMQNGLFHATLPLAARRCARGNKGQFWDVELEKNTFSFGI